MSKWHADQGIRDELSKARAEKASQLLRQEMQELVWIHILKAMFLAVGSLV